MKALYSGIFCALASVALAAQSAQPAPARGHTPARGSADPAAIEEILKANEQKISDAIAKNNLPAFKALVADTAYSIDEGGPMSAMDFEKNFAQIKIEPGSRISDGRFV